MCQCGDVYNRHHVQVLRSLLNAAGAGAVLLLEDVDAAFAKREAGDNARNLTFSGAACNAAGSAVAKLCKEARWQGAVLA